MILANLLGSEWGRLALGSVQGLGCALSVLLASSSCNPPPAAPERPAGPMELEMARRYVLELVNVDRRATGLPPVERDAVAERAAQEHAEDMAHLGFTAHWGSDGSVPEERYTLAGGVHFVQENAACFFDATKRELAAGALFEASPLEQIEAAFMGEAPPHDGHRKNILGSTHTGLGIGLAQPVGVAQPCMTQEFVDVRGKYEALPRKVALGQSVRVAGELAEPLRFGGVGVSRIDPRQPLTARHLNGTSSYPIPAPYQTYFPEGYQTPKPVQLAGRRFSIELPLTEHKRPGRYGVSVWAIYPDSGERLVMVSLRVVAVR
jgi:uncharacterized protein YkwD